MNSPDCRQNKEHRFISQQVAVHLQSSSPALLMSPFANSRCREHDRTVASHHHRPLAETSAQNKFPVCHQNKEHRFISKQVALYPKSSSSALLTNLSAHNRCQEHGRTVSSHRRPLAETSGAVRTGRRRVHLDT
ncbi:hypothetical protein CEXT_252131 [Caerostris extrusa]|uniref:Uncharacterized protein n=1 Tax=Caerostris extrusa TaxID=172846 RepID=A0AAV4Y4F8_CAEEX|nr:hypothetical protein CEXT_252131 [Caerostris extrusa]